MLGPARTLAGEPPRSESVYVMRMARVNVYLPDELAAAARAAELNVSAITQHAIRKELDARSVTGWLDEMQSLDRIQVDGGGIQRAIDEARDELWADG